MFDSSDYACDIPQSLLDAFYVGLEICVNVYGEARNTLRNGFLCTMSVHLPSSAYCVSSLCCCKRSLCVWQESNPVCRTRDPTAGGMSSPSKLTTAHKSGKDTVIVFPGSRTRSPILVLAVRSLATAIPSTRPSSPATLLPSFLMRDENSTSGNLSKPH